MAENRKNKLQIRNSTIDFLVFTRDAHEDGIEVRVQDQDVWLTQKAIGHFFDANRNVVSRHFKNVYESGGLSLPSIFAKFAQVEDNGKTVNISVVKWFHRKEELCIKKKTAKILTKRSCSS